MMRTPAHRVCVLWMRQTNSHKLQKSCAEKGMVATICVRKGPDPCLDRLLFLFWVHYIEAGPHLLCIGLL